jgi:hypothetical protein
VRRHPVVTDHYTIITEQLYYFFLANDGNQNCHTGDLSEYFSTVKMPAWGVMYVVVQLLEFLEKVCKICILEMRIRGETLYQADVPTSKIFSK